MRYNLHNHKFNEISYSPVTLSVLYFGAIGICFLCFTFCIHFLVETNFSKFLFFLVLTCSFLVLTLLGTKISGGYVLSDMLIIKPLLGKKIITPLNGVGFRTVSLSGKFKFTIVLVRLDGKKTFHFIGGGAEGLIAEQERMKALLLEMKKNKKVNHKPGSVNSVA